MVGAVLVAYGPDKILWGGLLYVVGSLVISPLLGLLVGWLFLKMTFRLSRNATPKINYFFNRMQIPSSIALALSHGANDVQKSIGLIVMSFVILGFSAGFHAPFWVIASCGAATALGTATGGWRIIKTMGSKIYRLRSVHAFCAQTSSATVILGAALVGGPVSTTHVVSSSIMGVGAGSEDLSRSVGSGEEYHPGLVYYYSSLSGDGGIKFFYSSVVAFICLSPSSIKKGG